MKSPNGKKAASDGKVLLELILAVPVLLMIPAGVMELARFIRLDQIAVVYSQETANRAYRQCTDYSEVKRDAISISPVGIFDAAATMRATADCLARVASVTSASLDEYLPGSQIVLSVYRYEFDESQSPPPKELTLVAKFPSAPGTDKFKTSLIEADGSTLIKIKPSPRIILSEEEARARQRIVVAEVTFKYSPVIGLFKAFFDGTLLETDGDFRETTIL